MQRGAERAKVLLVWGPKTLNTLMVLDFFECESVERKCGEVPVFWGCGGPKHWGRLMVLSDLECENAERSQCFEGLGAQNQGRSQYNQ